MNVIISGHHIDLTDALQDYVREKLGRIERHLDQAREVRVILSVEKVNRKAEAYMHVGGQDLYADALHEDMYAAIDTLMDKLDRQAVKLKEARAHGRARRGHQGLTCGLSLGHAGWGGRCLFRQRAQW